MFRLPDSWVWDFWFADDGERHHMFFLYASRALHDPDRRHNRASIGHAVSTDLTHWDRVADALVRSDAPACDDLATWTGSTVQHPDGTWFLFYTSAIMTPCGNRQTISYATSSDLLTWTKCELNPILSADPRWYETLASGTWHDEAFRDPWVLKDPDGPGWHMLITARSPQGPVDDRGVLGHAYSPDLRTWELRPPLTNPGQGFGQLEVPQLELVDEVPTLLFSCRSNAMAARRTREDPRGGGVWAARAASMLGPFDIAGADLVADHALYSGRIVRRRGAAEWSLMAFLHDDPDGNFVGEITDPLPFHPPQRPGYER